MAEDRFSSTASRFVDDRFQHQQRSLTTEQQRQEHRLATLQMGDLRKFARATEQAEDRYATRLRRIEQGYGKAADKLHKQQTGLVGRMQAMTKAGREVQAAQGRFLDDRAKELRIKAHRLFEAEKERQFEAAQAERLKHAKEMKELRQLHAEQRQAHTTAHGKNRPGQIEERTQTLQRVEESRVLTENFNTRSYPLPLSETPRHTQNPDTGNNLSEIFGGHSGGRTLSR